MYNEEQRKKAESLAGKILLLARDSILVHLRFLDAAHRSLQDYKTLLQEIIQKNPGERLSYVVTGETGPDHDKSFTVEVHLNSNIIGKGTGKSKKQAEQAAAKEALALMGLK